MFSTQKITRNVVATSGNCTNLSNPAVIAASTKFVSGPARPINAAPYSSYFTRDGLNGTGFAAKIGGKPSSNKTAGSAIVIIGSMCASGLSVILPSSLAVVSPSQSAANACIASWNAIAMNNAGRM